MSAARGTTATVSMSVKDSQVQALISMLLIGVRSSVCKTVGRLMEQTVGGSLMDSGILSGPSPRRKSAAEPVSAGILMDAWPKNGLDARMELCRWFMICDL